MSLFAAFASWITYSHEMPHAPGFTLELVEILLPAPWYESVGRLRVDHVSNYGPCLQGTRDWCWCPASQEAE